jgi:heterodisulfide reductase subunit B
MCHSNLDFRQNAINERSATKKQIPIVFLSELVGLSLGLNPTQLGLDRHFVSPLPLLQQIGAAKAAQAHGGNA